MPLLTLGKTVWNQNASSFTPGGLIPALLTGSYEINRNDDLHINAPNGIADGTLWMVGIKWTDPSVGFGQITWDPQYLQHVAFGGNLWGDGLNPGEYYTMFYQNGGLSFAFQSFARETGVLS